MTPLHVLMCLSLACMAWAGVVPSKPGLSLKDKLALDIPLKQHLQKTESKGEVVKVTFASTTTTTTPPGSTERPRYVEATLFRHQLTTPKGFVTELEPLDYEAPFDSEVPGRDYEGHFGVWEDDVGGFVGEIGASGRDLRSEAYIGGYRPLAF